MPVNREFSKDQIARLAGLDRFPRGEAKAIGELVDALMSAPSDHAAKEYVSDWIRRNRETPKPTEIREHFFSRELEEPARRAYCQKCSNTGYVEELRQVEPIPGMKYMAAFAVPCECRGTAV